MIEPTEFSVFGVTIGVDNISDFHSALSETYETLVREDIKWKDTGFCKREIASLWDGIADIMSRQARTFLWSLTQKKTVVF